jgi:site-specific recombinase XerD
MVTAIDLFLQHLSIEKGLAQKAIEDYQFELIHLCRFIDESGLNHWGEIKYYHLKRYKNYTQAMGNVNKFSPYKIGYIKSFFRFLYEQRLIKKSINYAIK